MELPHNFVSDLADFHDASAGDALDGIQFIVDRSIPVWPRQMEVHHLVQVEILIL